MIVGVFGSFIHLAGFAFGFSRCLLLTHLRQLQPLKFTLQTILRWMQGPWLRRLRHSCRSGGGWARGQIWLNGQKGQRVSLLMAFLLWELWGWTMWCWRSRLSGGAQPMILQKPYLWTFWDVRLGVPLFKKIDTPLQHRIWWIQKPKWFAMLLLPMHQSKYQ